MVNFEKAEVACQEIVDIYVDLASTHLGEWIPAGKAVHCKGQHRLELVIARNCVVVCARRH